MKVDPMFVNGKSLLTAKPLEGMLEEKVRFKGTSHGLAEAGYDLRISQEIHFFPPDTMKLFDLIRNQKKPLSSLLNQKEADDLAKAHLGYCRVIHATGKEEEFIGRFVLASATEEFDMPSDLVGQIKDKSTWARQGLSVFNTVVEPKWRGYLTLELVFHGNDPVVIEAEQGISQALFGRLQEDGDYGDGKYQNAAEGPQKALA